LTGRKRAVSPPAPVQGTPGEGVPHLLTLTAAARQLGIARGTLYKLVDTGSIAYVRLGADRRVAASELAAWIARSSVKAGER
jgi:excisionase family DNA binding protein